MFGYILLGTLSFLGCEAGKDKSAVKGNSNASVEQSASSSESGQDTVPTAEVSADRVGFYKTDFPNAVQFRQQTIPSDFLSDIDKGNSVYYDVLDANNTIIGHLRDFMGPVTDEENCPCSPLSLTLTYNTDFTLRNVISVAPLQKYGHELLTEEEHQQMVQIAQNPSEELLALQAPQDLIDGMTGATNLIYKDKVVDKAGYSSWRIANLAVDTAKIIQGAPIQRDADRLQQMLVKARKAADQMGILIEFIPTAESDYLRERALYILAELYMQSVLTGEPANKETEEVILNSGLGAFKEAELLTSLCLAFVEQKVALSFVSDCVDKLEQNEQIATVQSSIFILKGLLLLEEGKSEEALHFLEQGLSTTEQSPQFRQKMAILYSDLNKPDRSCEQLEAIYMQAPLWPNIDALLEGCGDVNEIKNRLDLLHKTAVLEDKVEEPKLVPVMELLDESSTKHSIDLSSGDKIRVIVFFATWCPHCQNEMPRLVDFYNQLQESDLKDKVEFLPIRAAIQRETQSFASFKRQFKIPFSIMTDEGIAFDTFAKAQGIQAGFPLLAVTNTKGEVAYFPSHGEYKDTVKELFWIVESM
ncbi:MAG: hypothetical protein CMK59_06470 [Proteobacteria bacterium]|nr:hypothetical protein [Pseudomonadota bacterium]